MGEMFPGPDCNLEDIGYDTVELFWSSNGQWVNNHHNYD